MLNFLEKKYWLTLGLICLFAFITRLYRVGEVQSYIFDEVYHAVTAKLIARNDPRAYEWWNPPVEANTAVDWLHPPLAKYTQALGMRVFGETPFGWRISAVLFGTAVILVIAEFVRYIFADKKLALLAAFLASLDGLLLVQSRIAMNDIHVTLMILLTFFSYFWYHRVLQKVVDHPKQLGHLHQQLRIALFMTAICAGLAMGSKWSGLFGLGVVWFFEFIFIITSLHKIAPTGREFIKSVFSRLVILGFIPVCVYILSYSHMFLQGKTFICHGNLAESGKCYCDQTSSWWVDLMKAIAGGDGSGWERLEARGGCKRLISHFSELHHQIWWYQTNLKATHNYQSRPWEWFLDLRPVWMYVKYDDKTIANIYSQGNPLLFWLGDVAVVTTVLVLCVEVFYFCRQKVKGKQCQYGQLLLNALTALTNFETRLGKLFFLIVAYFAVWLPWSVSPRIMFFYHYTPAVPLLAILLAYWLHYISQYKSGRIFSILAVVIIFATFVVFYPNWTGLPVPIGFANKVYFSLKSWK